MLGVMIVSVVYKLQSRVCRTLSHVKRQLPHPSAPLYPCSCTTHSSTRQSSRSRPVCARAAECRVCEGSDNKSRVTYATHASRVTLSNPFIFSTTKASSDLIFRLSARADAGSREETAACMLLLSEMLCCKKNASAFCRLATRLPKNWHSKACSAAARDCMLARNTLPRTGMSSLSSPSSAAAAACVAPTLAAAV